MLQVFELSDEQMMSHFTASDPLNSAALAAIAYILSNHDITKRSEKMALGIAGLTSSTSSRSFKVMHCCLLMCRCLATSQWQQLSYTAHRVCQETTLSTGLTLYGSGIASALASCSFNKIKASMAEGAAVPGGSKMQKNCVPWSDCHDHDLLESTTLAPSQSSSAAHAPAASSAALA